MLCISLDRALVASEAQKLGDSRYHAIRIARATSEFHTIVYSPEPHEPFRLGENVTVYPTGSRVKAAFPADALRLAWRIHREAPVDVIYTQDLYSTGLVGALLKRRLGAGLCALIAGDMIGNQSWIRESWLNRIWNRVGRWVIGRCDAIRVASTSEQQKLVALGVPPERIWKLGWFLDLERFVRADGSALRARLLEGGRFDEVILSVGRLVPQKDFGTLLRVHQRVARKRPGAVLVIAGGGPDQEVLRRLAAELGIADRVRFLGAVSAAEIPAHYAASDLFALSSVYEGNARVLAEASAAGLPIVATETSGTRDSVLDGDTGFVIPQGDVDQMADRVLELLSDRTRAQAMGSRGRVHAYDLFGDAALLRGFTAMFCAAAGADPSLTDGDR